MKLLREYINLFLIESRISDVQAKYPELNIHDLIPLDPSNNNKYLMWIAKQVEEEGLGADLEEIGNIIEKFHTKSRRLGKRDIYSYDSLYDLEKALQTISGPSNTEKKKNIKLGAETIYEDENVTVKYIGTKEASVQYGFDTKWCISMADETHFEYYADQENTKFYFIFANEPKGDDNDKIAVAVSDENENIQYYDASDTIITKLPSYYNISEILNAIKSHSVKIPTSDAALFFSGQLNDPEKRKQVVNELLKKYAKNSDTITVIMRKVKDTEHLAELAKHSNYYVRYCVATMTFLPEEIVETLLKDPVAKVRWRAIYNNHDLSWSSFKHLIDDPEETVRLVVARHKNTPPEEAIKLLNDSSSSVREALAERKDLDSNAYITLTKDLMVYVRTALVLNKSMPIEVLELLVNDPSELIRNYANKRLKYEKR